MKHYLIIGLIFLCNVGFSQILEMNPTSVRDLDLSVEGEKAYDHLPEAYYKIWDKISNGTNRDDLTKEEKEIISNVKKLKYLQLTKSCEMKTKNLINNIPETQKCNSYSVIIDIIRKGSYKKYSYRMVNNHFEAISFSLKKPPKTIISKNLSPAEKEKFAQYIFSFPLVKLEDSYYNKGIKGSYHLEYNITIGDKHKDIYVYFYKQNDLAELFKRLSEFIPIEERFNYFKN